MVSLLWTVHRGSSLTPSTRSPPTINKHIQFQFSVLVPPTLTWTPPGAFPTIWATFFEPSLSNSGNYAWSYADQISYQNFSGPLVIPPYYILEFAPIVPTASPTIVASVHSKKFLYSTWRYSLTDERQFTQVTLSQ